MTIEKRPKCLARVRTLRARDVFRRALRNHLAAFFAAMRREVYVGEDPNRPGLRPEQAADVIGGILEVPGWRVEGLMTVAPLGGDARTAFVKVRELKVILSKTFPRVHFGVLSMGMSDDYLVAIEEGSTEVRIGTALFGPRMTRF